MAKTPASKSASPSTAATEQPAGAPESDRLAALEAKIGEMSQRIAASPSSDGAVEQMLIAQQNERILELQRLVGSLGERMTAVQAVNARDEQFNAAVRSVESAAAAIQRGVTAPPPDIGYHYSNPASGIPGSDCGCERNTCGCVSCNCCTFEIWMSHVRVDHMQSIEPSDTNLQPGGEMEVWMFASIDPVHNIGVCIPDPSPGAGLNLHKQLTDPYGPWVSVNRCVGTVTVTKGVPQTVPLTLTAVEREDFAERALPPGNRDEWGSGTENITLDCCFSDYPALTIPVALTSWGQGGGAITGKFIVVKRC